MIYNILYDWQKEIVDKFKYKNLGIFLDCGLGKTPISLGLAEQNYSQKVIVITINGKAKETSNDNGSWFDWGSKSNMNYICSHKSQATFSNETNDLYVINYEGLYKRKRNKQKVELIDNLINFIKSCKDKNVTLIIDESHKMKNLQSMQTQAIFKLYRELRIKANNCCIYLLSGTPFTVGYIDLYSQLKILGCNMSKTEFIDEYCVRGYLPGLLGWQQPIVGYKNINMLYDLVHKYAITMKSDDIINLPEKTFVYHKYKTTDDFKMFLNEKLSTEKILDYCKSRKIKCDIKKEDKQVNNPFYRNIDYPDFNYLCETSGTFYLRAKQLSIGFVGNADKCIWYNRARLDMLKKFLQNNEDNYLLFYNYTAELLEIYQICEELGYNIDVYCGEIKSLVHYEKYASQKEEQQLVNKKNIILTNWASGSTGMNWQLYNQCILFSLPSYVDYEQGLKRIHRLGQKNKCVYHIFYQQNWLDNRLMQSIRERKEYDSKMFANDIKIYNNEKDEEK